MPLELASLSEDKRRKRETKERQEKEGKGMEAEVDEVVYITLIYRMGYTSANDILRLCL